MRIFSGLYRLSDQTLDDIIDKYKYILLNESLPPPIPPQTKISRLNPVCIQNNIQSHMVVCFCICSLFCSQLWLLPSD